MKVGIAITTYTNNETSNERYEVIEECFNSVKNNTNIDLPIYVINDGSNEHRLLEILDKFSDRFIIINREINGGISKAKNTCIKKLYDDNIDIFFLMDDDVIILKDFVDNWKKSILKTKIQHFNYIVRKLHPELEKYGMLYKNNGIGIIQSPRLNGCFMTITKEMVDKIGYFKVLPNRYGHEHTEYTLRAIRNEFAPGFCDLQNSTEYIDFHELAYTHRSEPNLIDEDKILENSKAAFDNEVNYVEFKD